MLFWPDSVKVLYLIIISKFQGIYKSKFLCRAGWLEKPGQDKNLFYRHDKVEQFDFWEYIIRILFAVYVCCSGSDATSSDYQDHAWRDSAHSQPLLHGRKADTWCHACRGSQAIRLPFFCLFAEFRSTDSAARPWEVFPARSSKYPADNMKFKLDNFIISHRDFLRSSLLKVAKNISSTLLTN